jgi:excisionase family DNA binding protein
MQENTPPDDKLLSLKDVAQRFQICERTVHNLLNSGELSGVLIARRWKFTEDAVQAFLKSKERKEGKGARKKRAYHRKVS